MKKILVAGVLMIFVDATTAPAQTSSAGHQIALIYDDQKVSDGDRAKLFSMVAASVPVAQWRTFTTTEPTELSTIVDFFFDYFPEGDYNAPLTVQAVIEAIQHASGVTRGAVPAGTPLRIPPLPVRAKGKFDYPRAFRVFNANTQGYAMSQNRAAVTLPMRRQTPAASSAAADPLRDATATGIVLQLTRENEAQLTPAALPEGVFTLSAVPSPVSKPNSVEVLIGMTPVELLTGQPTGCPNPLPMLDQSPFRSRQQTRVANAIATRKQELLALAKKKPLIILDIGFTSTHGSRHGLKVRTVAEQVLGALGAADLAAEIVAVELYPTDLAAQKVLSDALTDYEGSQPILTAGPTEFADRIARARSWLTTEAARPPQTGPRLSIPEILMQAVFWKHVTRGALLNMSFRMQAPATAQLLHGFSSGAISFAVVGVGNDVEPIKVGWTPQDATMAQSNFVTVTYGTNEGELKAQFGSHDGIGPRVVLLAPGCGFPGVAESGSSLASPYVAAAAWLRSLLDELESQKAPPLAHFWRELLAATRPIPALQSSVESGGMFDAAMLIAPPTRADHFIVKRDGSTVRLTDFRASAECKLQNGLFTRVIESTPPELQTESETFAVITTVEGTFLWKRTVPASGDGRGRAQRVCQLNDFSFSGNRTSVDFIDYPRGTMDKFAREIVLFAW